METEPHKTSDVAKVRGGTFEEAVKRMEGTRPTPTQEENDKAAMGEHVEKHAPDGSPEEKQPATVTAEEHKAARDKSVEQQANSKPTLTQEENDKHAEGETDVEHAPDGSPEQPPPENVAAPKSRAATAKPGTAYETRQVRARRTTEEKPADPPAS